MRARGWSSCHGLFGQGRNWTQIGKASPIRQARHRVLLLDMPQHGRSRVVPTLRLPRRRPTRWPRVADGGGEPVALVGHSMGGKIAMVLALRHPEQVARLCVVDVAPVAYDSGREFAGYVARCAGSTSPLWSAGPTPTRRSPRPCPNRLVRCFLLQNLRRGGDRWRWQPNLEVLGGDSTRSPAGPAERLAGVAAVRRPGAVGGAAPAPTTSTPTHAEAMGRWFPRIRRVTVKGAGHWVHSEQPEVFLQVLRWFLDG